MLVEVIVNSYWRLLRARRVETSALRLGIQALKQRNQCNPAPRSDDDDALAVFFTDRDDNMRNLDRYNTNIERSYFRAVETLRKVQNDRLREERRNAPRRRKLASFRRARQQLPNPQNPTSRICPTQTIPTSGSSTSSVPKIATLHSTPNPTRPNSTVHNKPTPDKASRDCKGAKRNITATDKLNDLQLSPRSDLRRAPTRLPNNLAIHLDRNSLRVNPEPFQQPGYRQPARHGPALAIDRDLDGLTPFF